LSHHTEDSRMILIFSNRKFVLMLSRPELFDEYTRRQYVAKAPKRNPFGTDEDPAKFSELDIFTKVGSELRST
jgi:hypothetical protein